MDIFVSNLPHQLKELDVQQLFEQFGKVTSVILIRDKDTKKSRGFGFVSMPNSVETNAAIKGLNGTEMNGRKIHAARAESAPKPSRPKKGDITEPAKKEKSFNAQVRDQNGGKFMSTKKKK